VLLSVGHDADHHNLLQEGRPFIMRLQELNARAALLWRLMLREFRQPKGQMRTVKPVVIVIVLSVVTTIAQDIPAAQPYDDADAYEIYSLLLPNYESNAYEEAPLTIQENTVPAVLALGERCLSRADADRFRGAVVGYYRIYEKRLLLRRRFQLVEPYKIVDTKVISTLPDHPYFSLSPVGFNRARTQAIVRRRDVRGTVWEFSVPFP
jgi:hypothetical protein